MGDPRGKPVGGGRRGLSDLSILTVQKARNMQSCRRALSVLGLIAAAMGIWALAAQGQAPSGVPEPGETFRDCPSCSEMVVVPAGDFTMGAREVVYEAPEHKVTIANAFAIGRREVTFDEWDACFAAQACKHRANDHGWGRGNRPVIDVSWDDVKVFIGWLAQTTGKRYRLPSEAEWEYSARAGTTTPFWWGRTADKG